MTKPFSIAGFVLAEIYMLFAVLAPLKSAVLAPAAVSLGVLAEYGVLAPLQVSVPVPGGYLAWRILCAAFFFGPFGALVGMGLGLFVGAILPKRES